MMFLVLVVQLMTLVAHLLTTSSMARVSLTPTTNLEPMRQTVSSEGNRE